MEVFYLLLIRFYQNSFYFLLPKPKPPLILNAWYSKGRYYLPLKKVETLRNIYSPTITAGKAGTEFK